MLIRFNQFIDRQDLTPVQQKTLKQCVDRANRVRELNGCKDKNIVNRYKSTQANVAVSESKQKPAEDGQSNSQIVAGGTSSASRTHADTATPSILAGKTHEKHESADTALRRFLESYPECLSFSSKELGRMTNKTDAAIRKTETWQALSKERKHIKEQNKIQMRLNNDLLTEAERKELQSQLDKSED